MSEMVGGGISPGESRLCDLEVVTFLHRTYIASPGFSQGQAPSWVLGKEARPSSCPVYPLPRTPAGSPGHQGLKRM